MPTIKDVALACGLSPATVSQVLNNGGRPVHPDTRARVLQAALALDYRPNAVARGLVKKRMNTIGLVLIHSYLPSHTNPFLTTILDGILAVNTRCRQNTTLCTISRWEQAEEHLPDLCDGRCDGVLVIVPPADLGLTRILLQRKMPFVLVNALDSSGEASSVDIDNIEAAYRMTEYLLQLGHRRIAFSYEPNESAFAFVREREEGYRRAMVARGLYDPALCGLSCAQVVNSDSLARLRPTAVFCAYDALALNLILELQRQGVHVPDDVSVAGFDDIPSISMGLPGLTTVRQPMTQIGEVATEMLLELIEGTATPGRRVILPTELVLRQSTASPPPERHSG